MQNRQILGLKVKKQALQDVKDGDKILKREKDIQLKLDHIVLL